MGEELYNELLEACALRGDRALIRMSTSYQPAGGPGAKIFPPTYPAANRGELARYVTESRVVDGEVRAAVLLDSVPSQANRCEEALLRARRAGRVQLPLIELQHCGEAEITLTSLQFPHRYADAYLRDSTLDGAPFDRSNLGRALQAATLDDATALFTHDPGSLVYGAWNSHRPGRQSKFPRIYSSELVGWEPQQGARMAGRMDPINLVGAVKPSADGWTYAATGEKTKGEKLSEIGHGNIAPNPAHGGVTVSAASRLATLSFAALDRIRFGGAEAAAEQAARAALAAYALLADRLTFSGNSLWLRSNCDLVVTDDRLSWVVRGGDEKPLTLGAEQAVELFALAQRRAAQVGLAMSTETVVVTPNRELARAIDTSITKAESPGE